MFVPVIFILLASTTVGLALPHSLNTSRPVNASRISHNNSVDLHEQDVIVYHEVSKIDSVPTEQSNIPVYMKPHRKAPILIPLSNSRARGLQHYSLGSRIKGTILLSVNFLQTIYFNIFHHKVIL